MRQLLAQLFRSLATIVCVLVGLLLVTASLLKLRSLVIVMVLPGLGSLEVAVTILSLLLVAVEFIVGAVLLLALASRRIVDVCVAMFSLFACYKMEMPTIVSKITAFLALLCLMTIMPHHCDAKIDLDVIVRNWESIAEQCNDVSIEYVTKRDDSVTSGTWLCRGRSRLLRREESESSGQYREEVFAENEDYSFQLIRRDRHRPWTLVSFHPRGSAGHDNYIAVRLDVGGVGIGRFPLAVHVLCATSLIKSPAYTVDSIEYTPDHLVSLAFHFNEGQEEAAHSLLVEFRKGVLTLDPARGFAVVGYDIVVDEDGSRIVQKSVAVPAPDGTPVEAAFLDGTRVYSWQKPNGKLTESGRTDIVSCKLGARVPFSEFRLGAFGLPEPGSVSAEQRRRVWWWIVLGGLAVGLTGLWVYRRQRSTSVVT